MSMRINRSEMEQTEFPQEVMAECEDDSFNESVAKIPVMLQSNFPYQDGVHSCVWQAED